MAGKDLALGAASLASGTLQGVFGSASSLSHAMVKGMAQVLSLLALLVQKYEY